MWVGIVIYADQSSSLWMRAVQVAFGILLLGWAVQRAVVMLVKPSAHCYSEEADGWNR
ncbi:hypothetical protein [Nonomuraea sp. NPDC003201]